VLIHEALAILRRNRELDVNSKQPYPPDSLAMRAQTAVFQTAAEEKC
jgi:hypothetical protein